MFLSCYDTKFYFGVYEYLCIIVTKYMFAVNLI